MSRSHRASGRELGIAATVLLLVASSAQSETVDVCEVLERLEELWGQTVAVRGSWKSGDTGEFLFSEKMCSRPIIWSGWIWQPQIRLAPANRKVRAALPPFDRPQPDRYAHHKMRVTFVGKVYTRDRFQLVRIPDGSKVPAGFRFAPALIEYESASELEIVPYEPGEELREYEKAKSPYPKPRR